MTQKLTDAEYAKLGRECKTTGDNLLVGSFAAELIGESYPFSKAQCSIVFKTWSDLELGKKFVAWMDGFAKKSLLAPKPRPPAPTCDACDEPGVIQVSRHMYLCERHGRQLHEATLRPVKDPRLSE